MGVALTTHGLPTAQQAEAPVGDEIAWVEVQRRDRRALEALCRQWMPTVLQWCRRLGGAGLDAEGAAQEVFIVLLDRLESLDGPHVVGSWLFSTTRRVLAQHRRRAWVQRWLPGVSIDHVAGGGNPERRSSARSDLDQVQLIVSKLPPRLAEVWVLVQIEQRTVPEIVALTGIPEGTLRTRLRRARQIFLAEARSRGLVAPSVAEVP